MQLTDRDVSILDLLLTFGYLVTSQIRSLVFPNDKDGSVTRDRLRKLEGAGLVQRRRAEVANPITSNTIPVWIITEQGVCQLSLRRNDTSILNQKPPCTRSWQNFTHYVAVADLMLKVKQAVAGQTRVQLGDIFFEHTVVNADADDAARRYKLYTVLAESPRRLICAPDASFELLVPPFRRPYYVELERGTDTPPRVAAKKAPGYHGLLLSKAWQRHYPNASDFRVLCVAPTSSWRDALRNPRRSAAAFVAILEASAILQRLAHRTGRKRFSATKHVIQGFVRGTDHGEISNEIGERSGVHAAAQGRERVGVRESIAGRQGVFQSVVAAYVQRRRGVQDDAYVVARRHSGRDAALAESV